MKEPSDQELLRQYVQEEADSAFAALVERYVDLVHSAAFRMSGDAHCAKDITQCAFVALLQNARQLVDRPTLAGWLHQTARNLAAKEIRSQIRRRTREQEAAAMNELFTTDSATNWKAIAPHLDAALGELGEPDRDAVLLRYFKNQDLRTVGATLGISDDAAQKRVSRAVERLREFLAKRGVTIGASGLVIAVSANAVQAAPAGLALTISAAAALTGTGLATTSVATATKAITMTAIHKTIITATIIGAVGLGIYQVRTASQLHAQVQTLQQQNGFMAEQLAIFHDELASATNQLTALQEENKRLDQNTPELLRLRGEIGVLRRQLKRPPALADESLPTGNSDPNAPSLIIESVLADDLSQEISNAPDAIPTVRISTGWEKLEIRYKCLNRSQENPGRYVYRLLGVDADWTETGTNLVAHYPKIPTGRYPFTVKLIDPTGIETSSTLNITIVTAVKQIEATAQSTNKALSVVPKESWAFTGYATPEAALQSWTWAYSKGDRQKMLGSLSPEVRGEWETRLADQTDSQLAADCVSASSKITGYDILDRTEKSDQEVVLSISLSIGDGRQSGRQPYRLVKVANEWKFAGPVKQ